MKTCINRLKPYHGRIILGQIFKFTEVILELIVPLLIGKMVDLGISNRDQNLIIKYAFICLGLAILGLCSALVCQYQASVVSQSYGTELRNDLFSHILKMQVKDVSKMGRSSLITRLTSDIQTLQQGVAMLIRLVPRTPFLCIGIIIMVGFINPKFIWAFLLAVLIFVFIIILITRKMLPLIKTSQKQTDGLINRVIELLSGIKIIRAVVKSEEKGKQFYDLNDEIAAIMEKIGFYSALLNPLTLLALNLIGVFILWMSGYQMRIGNLRSGDIIALINYLTMLLTALTVFLNLVLLYTRVFASSARLEEALLTVERPSFDLEESSEPKETSIQEPFENSIKFTNVNFAFPDSPEFLFENFSFTLPAGKSLSIIGPTGSGKSSLAYILERQYDIQSGAIDILGKEIRQYTETELLNTIQIVPQASYLFSGTLRESLCLGMSDIEDEQIWQALEIAQAADFVKKDVSGLNKVVQRGGSNFSGGQKQRLAIARALLRKTKVIVFDDTSSALDLATDAALQKALRNSPQFKDHCFITITQRISTARRSDLILLLDNGEKVGFGSHQELLENNTLYQEIYDSQIAQEKNYDENIVELANAKRK